MDAASSGELLFHHGFAHQHQIIHIALPNLCIELCDIGYTASACPMFQIPEIHETVCLVMDPVIGRKPDTWGIKTNGKMGEIRRYPAA